jgi:hypothetical protein
MSGIVDFTTKVEHGSSHVVNLAIAEDDKVFQEYLCNTSYGPSSRMVRFHLTPNQPDGPSRPIVFNTVPKRGMRETEGRLRAASRLDIVEKIIAPYRDDLIDL